MMYATYKLPQRPKGLEKTILVGDTTCLLWPIHWRRIGVPSSRRLIRLEGDFRSGCTGKRRATAPGGRSGVRFVTTASQTEGYVPTP